MSRTGFAFSVMIIITGLALIGLLLFPSYREYKRNQRINGEIEKLSQEAERLRESNAELAEKIEYFKTEAYKEKIAKERLNLQKADEQVVVIKPSASMVDSSSSQDSKERDGKNENFSKSPNYKKWINYFFESL